VYLGWGPASRDPAVYDEPLRWDLDRDRKGRAHTAFGLGRHRCLGAPLGTLELVVALREFVRRLPDFTVEPGFEPRYSAAVNRTIARIPITY
jgi:cytochrome P450